MEIIVGPWPFHITVIFVSEKGHGWERQMCVGAIELQRTVQSKAERLVRNPGDWLRDSCHLCNGVEGQR